MAKSEATRTREETWSKAADLPRDEEDRLALDLVWNTNFKERHHFYLPARTHKHHIRFIVDTGSPDSVISLAHVERKQIQPSDTKEIYYISHAIKILGKASVTLFVGKDQQEIVYDFLVADIHREHTTDLVAMNFLTDFECIIHIDSELRLTMSRTPREPQAGDYNSPYLDLAVSAGKGEATRYKFLVDTGGSNALPMGYAETAGARIVRRGLGRYCLTYRVKGNFRIDFGSFSRQMKDPLARESTHGTLCQKFLMRTVVNLKDWSMTFKGRNGDVTLPLIN